jgi:tRNA(fMet)-specific endonuclease VapC
MICLDTNVAIAAINMRPPRIRGRLAEQLGDGVTVGIPAIVLFELWYGIRKSDRAEANAKALTTFLTLDLALWPFEPDDAAEAGSIRAAIERAGTPIGPYDILIAAQARRRGATLVTANRREFDRIPGLSVIDWAND